MRSPRSFVPLAMLLATVIVPTTAFAQAPPTLTGESFFVTAVNIPAATCNPTGTSTFTYSAQGAAVGPYPGTFTEVGTITIGPLTLQQFVNGFQFGPITSVEAFFTIDSTTGQVTGTKRLTQPTSDAFALCYDFTNRQLPDGEIATGTFRDACACNSSLSYEATIESVNGLYGDQGASGLIVSQFKGTLNGASVDQEVFNETFVSSLQTPFPINTPGHVTGGGQIPGSVTFGLEAKNDDTGMIGRCTVVDRLAGTMVKCLDVTTFAQIGTHVTFSGNATVNGVQTRYTIDVDDLAEPGHDADTFKIVTAGGYAAAGVLSQGNIQVHGQ